MSLVVSTVFAFVGLVCLVSGQYQVPIPYQQHFQGMYQPQTRPSYQPPYYYPQFPQYPQPIQSYGYPQTAQYTQGVYPQLVGQTNANANSNSNQRLVLPHGYRIEPLTGYPQMTGGNQRMVLPYGYRIEPLDENDITAELPTTQQQLQQVYQSQVSQQPLAYQPQPQPQHQWNQPRQYQSTYVLNQPGVTVDVVTSSPPEYIVHENSYTTKYSNTNNTGIHIVEHKPFNSTIRRVFTTGGDQSENKVYTINIVNGVEVTTTEDPNAIDGHNGNNQSRTNSETHADDSNELEENSNNEKQEKDEDTTLKPVKSWFF